MHQRKSCRCRSGHPGSSRTWSPVGLPPSAETLLRGKWARRPWPLRSACWCLGTPTCWRTSTYGEHWRSRSSVRSFGLRTRRNCRWLRTPPGCRGSTGHFLEWRWCCSPVGGHPERTHHRRCLATSTHRLWRNLQKEFGETLSHWESLRHEDQVRSGCRSPSTSRWTAAFSLMMTLAIVELESEERKTKVSASQTVTTASRL